MGWDVACRYTWPSRVQAARIVTRVPRNTDKEAHEDKAAHGDHILGRDDRHQDDDQDADPGPHRQPRRHHLPNEERLSGPKWALHAAEAPGGLQLSGSLPADTGPPFRFQLTRALRFASS